MNIVLGNAFAYIEATAHAAAVALFADVGSVFFLFILVETFAGRNGKVTILKLC